MINFLTNFSWNLIFFIYYYVIHSTKFYVNTSQILAWWLFDMFEIYEPDWWLKIIEYLNNFMDSHWILQYFVPITAEIFVFFFPIVLIVLYVIWIVRENESFKKSSLWTFWCAILTIMINICIKSFFHKERPLEIWVWWDQIIDWVDSLLPNSCFPSDHAAMSMWFAMWLLLRWINKKDKLYIWMWILFLVFSLIMSISRVIVWEHWPSDILWWLAVWIIVTLILNSKNVYKILNKFLIDPLIRFQCRLFKKIGIKN